MRDQLGIPLHLPGEYWQMSNVVELFPKCVGVIEGLRNIADKIERGDIVLDRVTLVTAGGAYHLGTDDDREAAQAAVFDLTYGIHKMMEGALS